MPNPVSNRGSSWSSEQLSNARVIAQVGRSLGASSRDIQIAIMAAIVESGLRNLNYGDRDSIGLFQQRNAWGSRSARLNPTQAARMFFLGGGQGQRGLLDFKDRNSMSLGRAAQAVQVSAFPSRYGAQEQTARALMGKLGSAGRIAPSEDTYKLNEYGGFEATDPTGMGLQAPRMSLQDSPVDNPLETAMDKILDDGIGGDEKADSPEALGTGAADEEIDWGQWSPMDALFETGAGIQGSFMDSLSGGQQASGLRSAVLNMAKSFIGRPYRFGANGPSAFDCSSLVQYTLKKMGVSVPRLAYQQANFGKQTSIKNIKPGDLVFWGNSRRTQGNHIAFYLGNGKILEAPRPGLSVRIRSLGGWDKDDGAIGVRLDY